MLVWQRLLEAIDRHGKAAMATIVATRGSVPREAGARMVVLPDASFFGTIGGGTLEWHAIAELQAALSRARPRLYERRSVALGPELGQCCGGRIDVAYEIFPRARRDEVAALAAAEAQGPFRTHSRFAPDGSLRREPNATAKVEIGGVADDHGLLLEGFGEAARPVMLFGAGHVGRAIVMALAPLPFRIRWVDERPDAFPRLVPQGIACIQPTDTPAVLDTAPADSFVLILSHSHTLDQAIIDRALRLERFPYVGLIGSATKKARFRSRLAEAGVTPAQLDRMICPIGIGGIRSKHPAAIAASVAADLLIRDEALRRTEASGAQAPLGTGIALLSAYAEGGR